MFTEYRLKLFVLYILIPLLSCFAKHPADTRILPPSGDFINFVSVGEAEQAGWMANYNSRLGVVEVEDGYAVEARGASHHGGLRWFPANLDLTNAKKMRFKIRQNVYPKYNFTIIFQFDNGNKRERYVAKEIPHKAGWKKWEKVEIDLTDVTLGKPQKIGIYGSHFKDTDDKYLQIDELNFIVEKKTQSAQPIRPTIAIPKFKSPPIIDGTIDDREWAKAAKTTGFVTFENGNLSDRQTVVYLCYDDEYLYAAYESDYYTSGDFDRGKKGLLDHTDLDDTKDFIELWIKPDESTYHQFMVNMNGGIFERDVYGHKMTNSQARAECKIKLGAYLAGGKWYAEIAIPFSGLGVEPPQPGQSWLALFCRDFAAMGRRSGLDWTSSVFTNGDFNKPNLYGKIVFTENKPVVRINSLGMMKEGKVTVDGEIAAPDTEIIKASIEAVGYDTGTLLDEEKKLQLNQGINSFTLGKEVKTAAQTKAVCTLNFTSENTNIPLYSNNFSFVLGTPLRFKCISRARSNTLLVEVGASRVNGLTANNNINVFFKKPDSGTVVMETSFPYPIENKTVLHEINCQNIEKGYYRIEAEIVNSKDEVLCGNAQSNVWVGAAEWANNNIGISKQVPPPWKPIEVEDNTVRIVERSYVLGDNGLPLSINAIGKELLSSPAKLAIRTQKGTENIKFKKIKMLSTEPASAKWQIEGKSSGFNINGNLTIEYDGMAFWEIVFEPTTRSKIDEMYLSFEIPKSTSLYARGKTMGSEAGGYAAVISKINKNAQEIELAKTRYCPDGWPWNDRFFYEFFIGDDDSGITLINDSAQYHRGDQHIELTDNGQTRTLKVYLTSNHDIDPQKPLIYKYGWTGLPLRPRPTDPNAWHVTLGPTGKVDAPVKDIDPEMFKRCPIVIAGRLLRYDSHYQLLHPDPAKRVKRRAGHQRADIIGNLIKPVNKMGAKVIPDGIYWSDADTSTPQAKKYIEEWKLIGSGVSYWNYQNALDIGACTNSSWLDFQTYCAKRILENGMNGVYLDVSQEFECSNPYHGCGYVDYERIRRKTVNIWSNRELHKRVYTYYKSVRPVGVMYHHHLDSAAWAGFCDGGFQGEELATERNNPRDRAYQSVTPEFFRVMTMNQYGTPYTWYALFSYYGWTPMSELMAMCLPHNTMPAIWNVRHNQWPDVKPYWDILDKWWTGSDFAGYWHEESPAKNTADDVLISAIIKNNNVLLIAANWKYQALKNYDIELNENTLNIETRRCEFTNALTGKKINPENNHLKVNIKPRDVILIEIKKPIQQKN